MTLTLTCWTVADFLMWRALSDERTGLSFTIAPGPRQRRHFPVRLPWDSWPYLLCQTRDFPFRRLLRLSVLRWRYSTPPPHGSYWVLYYDRLGLAKSNSVLSLPAAVIRSTSLKNCAFHICGNCLPKYALPCEPHAVPQQPIWLIERCHRSACIIIPW
jgi:hypothetical protein